MHALKWPKAYVLNGHTPQWHSVSKSIIGHQALSHEYDIRIRNYKQIEIDCSAVVILMRKICSIVLKGYSKPFFLNISDNFRFKTIILKITRYCFFDNFWSCY